MAGVIRTVEAIIPATSEWQALCERHLAFVHRAVRRLAGPVPAADVEDLVQEVFLVAHRRWSTFEGRSEPTSWLYGICLKVVAGHRRRAWVKALVHRADMDEAEELSGGSDPHAAFDRGDSEKIVYRILGTLSEKRRTVLILYEIEELPGEEIARILGIPVKTVWTRLHHARREFREKATALLGPGGGR